MRKLLIVLSVCLIEVALVQELSIPNRQLNDNLHWIKPCDHQDPNKNNCFRDLLQSIVAKVIKGIPEVDIKPFDPLSLNEIKVHRTAGQIITLEGGFDNVKVYGLTNTSIPQAYFNMQKKLMNFKMEIPKIRLSSSYRLKGNILLLPIVGNGNINILLKNVKTTIYTKFSLKNLPEEAINFEVMRVVLDIEKLRIHLDNLFNGNKELEASFLMLLNQNSKEIFAELRTDLQYELAKIFIEIWNDVFNKIPLKHMLT
ncbi:circadian clock-controlled protein daywake-like [Chironomus tepperi]|uniref:circadian clock-controlled protein daywake-like n=1 Tax=Chironomus tepperi TaxID=113505 RepID=UPI00391F8CB7